MTRQRKIRLTYVERTPEQIENAVCEAVYQGGVLWDFFSSVIAEPVTGQSEFDRGVKEGMRALADQILTIAMRKPATKIETSQEE